MKERLNILMGKKLIKLLPYIYIGLPIVIFFLGWTKWYFSIPIVIIIAYSFYRITFEETHEWKPCYNKNTVRLVLIIALIIGIWVYFSGVGGLVWQNDDQPYRNQIFNILVKYDWPVALNQTINGEIQTRGLVYYLAFWLPSALIGKVFGLTAGYLFQAVWAFIGVSLVYYYICAYLKRLSIWPLFGFIFFSGLDIVGSYFLRHDINSVLYGGSQLEWWCTDLFEYSSFTTQLFWVFNQAIYAWILIALIMNQKNNKHLILILSCGLLESTIPFVGLLPFVVYKFIENNKELGNFTKKTWKKCITGICTLENVVAGGCIGIITFIYLKGNVSAQNILAAHHGGRKGYLFMYLVFLILEVGVYFLAIYRYQKNNKLFWLIVVVLCVCPLIKVGFREDFCMRASIPALFLLFLLVMETLYKSVELKDRVVCIILSGLLLLGSVTPILQLSNVASNTAYYYYMDYPVLRQSVSEEEIMTAPNFSGNVEDSFFYKYLAK